MFERSTLAWFRYFWKLQLYLLIQINGAHSWRSGLDWETARFIPGTASTPLPGKAWTQLGEQQEPGLFSKSRLNAITLFWIVRDSSCSNRKFAMSLASMSFALFTSKNYILGCIGNLERRQLLTHAIWFSSQCCCSEPWRTDVSICLRSVSESCYK